MVLREARNRREQNGMKPPLKTKIKQWMNAIYVGKAQLAKVVARPQLNPENDSDGMTCAASAEGWEMNAICLSSGKSLPQLQGKNATSTRAVRPSP